MNLETGDSLCSVNKFNMFFYNTKMRFQWFALMILGLWIKRLVDVKWLIYEINDLELNNFIVRSQKSATHYTRIRY